MAVMEVLLIIGLLMGPAGLLVQADNVNQSVELRARYYRESRLKRDPHLDLLDVCPPDPHSHDLLRLIHTQSCLPAVTVWQMLIHLTPECRNNILTRLSAHFGPVLNIPSYCQCDQRFFVLPHFTVHGGHEQHDHDSCMRNDYEYSHLYNTYVANDANYGHGVCTTHHQVWHHLHNVHHTGEFQFCRDNLIKQLSHAYDHQSGYHCATVPITVTAAPAVTTTPLASVLAIPCKKYATLNSLAYEMQFHHPLASSCGTTNDHRGSEALVFNLCQTKNDTSQWKEGPNVMSNCHNIPLYTPIATFINGVYSSNGGLSGIFLGCLPDGFKIAVQECGSNATILNLGHGGILTHDPNLYFLVTE